MKMLRAQLNEVVQQPDESEYLLLLFLLARADDVFAESFDPDVAIVKIAERGLNARGAFRAGGNRAWPAGLKEFHRIAQALRGDAHFMERLDRKRFEQAVGQFFKLSQTIEDDGARDIG